MTTAIQKEDVQRIASELKREVTEAEIEWVLRNYDDYEKMYPTDNWSEIVEQMLDEIG